MKRNPALAFASLLLIGLLNPPSRGQEAPSQDITLADNPKQRYILIGVDPAVPAPEKGYSLLLVMPGGDGGPDFTPFVKNIHMNALPGNKYIVRNLVSLTWQHDNHEIREKNDDWEPTLLKRGFYDIIEHFLACVEHGDDTTAETRDALITHQMCEALVFLLNYPPLT